MSVSSKPESKEEADFIKNCEDLIQTLPKGKGFLYHVYNYNGFWCHPSLVTGNMLLNTYFKAQPCDIFLASYIKSGTTWLKALIFTTINRHNYTFSDHPLLHQGPHSTFHYLDTEIYPITDFSQFPEPRLFSTHFPRTLLPSSITASACKVVYVCRDPKDVLISKWIFLSKQRPKDLPPLLLDEAFELFCQGLSECGPYWDHVLSYWRGSLESPEKILFMKYEELKKQPVVELKRLAEFIGKPFTMGEEENGVVEEIVKLCSFESLSNLEVNKKGVEKFGRSIMVDNQYFFRKGETGDWKNHLSEEMKQRIDGITDEKLRGSGLILGAN